MSSKKKPTIDLDALREARYATYGDAPVVVFKGETFTLDHERPFAMGEALFMAREQPERARHHIWAAVESLLPDEQLHRFTALKPTDADIAGFLNNLSNVWEEDGVPIGAEAKGQAEPEPEV